MAHHVEEQKGLFGLKLTGAPFQRGLTHGEVFADEISNNLDIYLEVFEHKGVDEDTIFEQVEEFIALIEDENGEYFEEMQGISEGSDLSIQEITVLNARYEVMYSALSQEADQINGAPPDGCTAFGVQPEGSVNGHTYLGQNWDWVPGLETFVMEIHQDDNPDLVAMTEAGIVGGKIGVNEAGIGMTLNGLVTGEDGENPIRKPYHVRFREVLNSEKMDKAIKPLISKDRACSGNVIVAHSEGEMVNLELFPEKSNYLYAEDGLLIHTNHVEGASAMESEFEKLMPDTLCRAPRMRRLLSQKNGNIDEDVLKETLQDHFSYPNSICRHPDEDDQRLDQLITGGSFIMDLNEQLLLGTDGPPCEHDYVGFRVGS